MKFVDLTLDVTPIIATATVVFDSLNLIAQGFTESQRIGRKCTIRKVQWRWDLSLISTTNLAACTEVVRMVVFQDKQCNGAIAPVDEILENDDYQSFRNLANGGRFRILMDRSYTLTPSGAAGNGSANDTVNTVIHDSFYKDVNIVIEFDGVAGAITEVRTNNIGIMLMSRTGSLVNFASQIRIRFTDA